MRQVLGQIALADAKKHSTTHGLGRSETDLIRLLPNDLDEDVGDLWVTFSAPAPEHVNGEEEDSD